MPGKKRAAATTEAAEICSERDLDEATAELCRLLSLGRPLTPTEDRRFRLLTNAVEAYERVHYPIVAPSQAALLEHLLEAKGETPGRLATATRISQGDIAAILNGDRDINPQEAAVFARHFHVEESVFAEMAPTVCTARRRKARPATPRRK